MDATKLSNLPVVVVGVLPEIVELMAFTRGFLSGFLVAASKSVELPSTCQHSCEVASTTILIMMFHESYDGGVVVTRSIEMREPVIFVSMNYR